ncbi:hypothetical protein Vafri_19030, partial [Volvox africanus]
MSNNSYNQSPLCGGLLDEPEPGGVADDGGGGCAGWALGGPVQRLYSMGSLEFHNLLGGPVNPMPSPGALVEPGPVHLRHAAADVSMPDGGNRCSAAADGGGGGGDFVWDPAEEAAHAIHFREMEAELGPKVRNPFATGGLLAEMPPQPTKSGDGPSSLTIAAAAAVGSVREVSGAPGTEIGSSDIGMTTSDAAASGAVQTVDTLLPNHNSPSVTPPLPMPTPPSSSPLTFQAAATYYTQPNQAAAHHLLGAGAKPPVAGGNLHLACAPTRHPADRAPQLRPLYHHRLQQFINPRDYSTAAVTATAPPSVNMQPTSIAPTSRSPSLQDAQQTSLLLPPGPSTPVGTYSSPIQIPQLTTDNRYKPTDVQPPQHAQSQHDGDDHNPTGGASQLQTLY